MARLKRFCPVGIAQHVIQRGNNRQVCFNGDEDQGGRIRGSRGQTPPWIKGSWIKGSDSLIQK